MADLSKDDLRQTVFDYIKAGETHSILVGFSVDTVNGSDDRLMEWCDRMVGYVIDAVDYRETNRKKTKKPDGKMCPGVVAKRPAKKTAKKAVKKS